MNPCGLEPLPSKSGETPDSLGHPNRCRGERLPGESEIYSRGADPAIPAAILILTGHEAGVTGRWSRRSWPPSRRGSDQAAIADLPSRSYALTHLRIALSETPYLRPTAE
jgi:hypothetical protein